jgi:hypothetical protein
VGGSLYSFNQYPHPFSILYYYSNTTLDNRRWPIRVNSREFVAKNHPACPGSLSPFGGKFLVELIRRKCGVQVVTRKIQVGTNRVQVGTNTAQVGTNGLQVGTNRAQVGTKKWLVNITPMFSTFLFQGAMLGRNFCSFFEKTR